MSRGELVLGLSEARETIQDLRQALRERSGLEMELGRAKVEAERAHKLHRDVSQAWARERARDRERSRSVPKPPPASSAKSCSNTLPAFAPDPAAPIFRLPPRPAAPIRRAEPVGAAKAKSSSASASHSRDRASNWRKQQA